MIRVSLGPLGLIVYLDHASWWVWLVRSHKVVVVHVNVGDGRSGHSWVRVMDGTQF